MAAAKFLQWAMFWTFEKRTVDDDRKLISAGFAGLQHPALLRCDEALRPPCGDSSAGVRQAVHDIR